MKPRYDPDRHHRRSIRLKGYDYGQVGAYFVTVCAYRRECVFGDVVDGGLVLGECGRVVEEEWYRTAQLRPYVRLDAHVVMPNHFHGVIWIVRDRGGMTGTMGIEGTIHRAPTADVMSATGTMDTKGTIHRAPTTGVAGATEPTTERFGKPVAGSLPSIIRTFKAAVTRRINRMRDTPGAQVWQRNYYEHVIRTERVLNAIRQYIADNPARWMLDRYHPTPAGRDPQADELWSLMKEDTQ